MKSVSQNVSKYIKDKSYIDEKNEEEENKEEKNEENNEDKKDNICLTVKISDLEKELLNQKIKNEELKKDLSAFNAEKQEFIQQIQNLQNELNNKDNDNIQKIEENNNNNTEKETNKEKKKLNILYQQ